MFTRIRKSRLYCRLRQYFPFRKESFFDDRGTIERGQPVLMEWPAHIKKPLVGIVQDYGRYPGWTKYLMFLETNSFPYAIYPIHNQNWLEKARDFDVIIGMPSNSSYHLEEIRTKYYLLETYLDKSCYPSASHALLYEDKKLESFLSKLYRFPFINTYVSYSQADALCLIEDLAYPLVSKIIPSASSVGVEMVHNRAQAKRIINKAFSQNGRKTHLIYFRQKNFVYFQDFIASDGYDLRVIVVGNHVFGFYRRVLKGDFRASGMNQEEKRELPQEAMQIARKVNTFIKSPLLVVDMVHGRDGKYYINEFSPLCQMSTIDQLQVDGMPGAYVFNPDGSYHFEPGVYWVHELALKEFFLNYYLPKLILKHGKGYR